MFNENGRVAMDLEAQDRHAAGGFSHIELFAGAGGLAVGCQAAGLPPAHLFEVDDYCCRTLEANIATGNPSLLGAVTGTRVEDIGWETYPGNVKVIAAGAPCQPFSLGGRHLAWRDGRNLFPEVFRAIRALRPDVVILENVRGLQRPDFSPYFEYILAQVADPSIVPRNREETWQDHFRRLRQHTKGRGYRPEYQVFCDLFNAANYGVPQLRHRIFIIAVRDSMPPYAPPEPTHSKDALLVAQQRTHYWDARGVSRRARAIPSLPRRLDRPDAEPWLTVRDAIQDLPPPSRAESTAEMNHWRIAGARSYAGHSGSRLDWPAKTVKAGVHGVPGGENTVIDKDGRVRYFTLREAARIQTFPDNHFFCGARTHVTKQIGNAVPCTLAQALVGPVRKVVLSST